MSEQNKQNRTLNISLNGCLPTIILAAIAVMAVRACGMVNMKYEEQQVKHKMYMDSINKVRNDTLYYRGK